MIHCFYDSLLFPNAFRVIFSIFNTEPLLCIIEDYFHYFQYWISVYLKNKNEIKILSRNILQLK